MSRRKSFAKPSQNRRRRRGLTLIEILVVVAILGLIAGVVGVNVVDQFEEAKIDTTKDQIGRLTDALNLYKTKIGKYPSSTEGIQALVSPPNGKKPLMETVPNDAWNTPFVYISPGQRNTHKFDLYSKGPDGQAGTEDDITNWK